MTNFYWFKTICPCKHFPHNCNWNKTLFRYVILSSRIHTSDNPYEWWQVVDVFSKIICFHVILDVEEILSVGGQFSWSQGSWVYPWVHQSCPAELVKYRRTRRGVFHPGPGLWTSCPGHCSHPGAAGTASWQGHCGRRNRWVSARKT